jgi:hypothetical protein
MLTLFAILGVLGLIFATIMAIVYPNLRHESTEVEARFGKRTNPASPKVFRMWNLKKRLILAGVSLVLIILNLSMFYAQPGHQYYLVSPTGTKGAVFNSGYHFITPFTRIQEWEKFVDIKVINGDDPTEGIEGVIKGGIPIRFIDQVKASAQVSVRMQLPTDPVSFTNLAEEFRHPKNLVNNTLVPTVREQVINTGYMFAAQDYISGAASDFRQTLDDQLKNGGFSVEKKEYLDTTYVNNDIQTNESRKIREVTTRYEVEVRQKNGKPVRVPHDITKNNVIVSQVIVDEIRLEQAFQKRLEKQRDIASQKRIEMEAVEAAKIRQQKIIAEGETEKAAERARQEKEQVKTLIKIETQVKQEESKRQLAEIAFKTAQLEAKAKKVKADADAYQNRKLVQAGLTPQERAQIEKEIAVGVAHEISNLKLPEIYMGGNGNSKSSAGLLESLIGAEMANKMLSPKVTKK